jgi:hypothetical protein
LRHDKPAERKIERTSRFVRKWGKRGFRADPPNAALSIARAGGDVMSFELKRPRLARGWLHYSARPLKDGAKGPKPVELGRFGTASVFIDNASAGLCFGFIVGPSSCGDFASFSPKNSAGATRVRPATAPTR